MGNKASTGNEKANETTNTSKAKEVHVCLVGDSTLDNLIWVDGQKSTVTGKLTEMLAKSGGRVTNLAADGFTSTDVLVGAVPSLSGAAREKAGDPFPMDGGTWRGSVLAPLKEIVKLKNRPTHIVLSIGGNDVRHILREMHQLPATLAKFNTNFAQIVTALRKITPNVIIMLQYRPALNCDGHYGVYEAMGTLPFPGTGEEKLNRVMESIYPPVFDICRDHGMHILDLSRSFDIHDDRMFKCQIEPSAHGSTAIARLIYHAVCLPDRTAPVKPAVEAQKELGATPPEVGGVVAEGTSAPPRPPQPPTPAHDGSVVFRIPKCTADTCATAPVCAEPNVYGKKGQKVWKI